MGFSGEDVGGLLFGLVTALRFEVRDDVDGELVVATEDLPETWTAAASIRLALTSSLRQERKIW